MRYINKEYGFAFRPPYYDKFYEEKNSGLPITGENFPGRFCLGVGYDYEALNGAMLVGRNGSMWGVRAEYFDGNKWLLSGDFSHRLGASTANTADGSFAHFTSGPLSVKWARNNESSLVFKVSAHRRLRVRVVFYPVQGISGELSIEGAKVLGRSPHLGIIPGTLNLTDHSAVFEGRYLVICDSEPRREYFFAYGYSKPSAGYNGPGGEAVMEFVISKRQPAVHFYAVVGDEALVSEDPPRRDKMQKQIETAELRYGVNKTFGTGVLGEPCERMLNSILWSRVYYPYLMAVLYAPARTKLSKHFDIRGLEENCSAILGSMAGLDIAAGQLYYTLEDKIMSLLAVWLVYARSTDKSGILTLFETLSSLYPPDENLVVSEDPDKNEVAYKWDDSPLKEANRSPMYSLDMSCLKLLALDILERICRNSGLEQAGAYALARKKLAAHINEKLWDERRDIYANRYVMGQWGASVGATGFYPLICGAVEESGRLYKLLNTLTDPKRFWTLFPVPTLSADDPQFGKKGKPNNNGQRKPPFLDYRGSVVPYVNFLIYQGLVRYGLDELAGVLAEKSAKLWAENASDNVENYSLYRPAGARFKNPEFISSGFNMLAMIGVCELIDLEYFRPDFNTGTIRFGTFVEGSHSLTNIKLLGRSYSIDVSDDATVLLIDGAEAFRGEGGRFVVRNFLETETGFTFLIDAHALITLKLTSILPKQPVRYFLIAPAGKSAVTAERGTVAVEKIKDNR
ncbi:MAG: hypothetical protein FWD58_04270 [Firmicutes bacterium]|nr:hypothetical protein [Bacillota bacterium]